MGFVKLAGIVLRTECCLVKPQRQEKKGGGFGKQLGYPEKLI